MEVTTSIIVLLGLCCLFSTSLAEPARFDNYQIYRVNINDQNQLKVLQNLPQDLNDLEFLDEPKYVGQSVEVIVPPNSQTSFLKTIEDFNSELLVSDLQTLINKGAVKSRDEGFGWDAFHTLEEIYQWMDTLPELYPEIVTKIIGGQTYEGRQIEGVLLSKNSQNPDIFVEANIHAREWITSASATWIINQLLTSTDPEVQELLNNYNWHFFPVINPDGFEFSHTNYRLWRKTRSRQGLICFGVDPNRNWDIFWQAGGGGSSDDICSDTFAGPTAFSEIETLSLSEYVTSISENLKLYISFHSAAHMILFPWGHTEEEAPNHDDLMAIATETYARLHAVHGTVYTFGPIISTIYETTGVSADWAYGSLGIKLSFTYEFRNRGDDGEYYGFVAPPSEIVPNAEEVLQSLIGMTSKAKELGYFD